MDKTECKTCGTQIPFGLTRCNKCRYDDRFAKLKRRGRSGDNFCATCKVPITLESARIDGLCVHCRERRRKLLDREWEERRVERMRDRMRGEL